MLVDLFCLLCFLFCSGFAINLKLLLSKTEASFDMNAMKGRLEESILLPLVTQDELEPRADNCRTVGTFILVVDVYCTCPHWEIWCNGMIVMHLVED